MVHEFGCKSIIKDNGVLFDYIKEPEVNQQASAMIVKFAPNYTLLKTNESKQIYIIEVKQSVSLTWALNRLKMIREK